MLVEGALVRQARQGVAAGLGIGKREAADVRDRHRRQVGRSGDELGIARCETCSICYVFDLLSLPRSACPACPLFRQGDTGFAPAPG